MGLVFNNDRTSVAAPHDDRAATGQWSTEEGLENEEIVGRGVTKGVQRQNSSVRTRRDRKPLVVWCFTPDVDGSTTIDGADDGETRGCNPGSPLLAETLPG
jgi:hypothetical protein